MTLRMTGVCFLVGAAVVAAQSAKVDVKAEESAIRALIAKGGNPPRTDDSIMWTGIMKRPRIGNEAPNVYPDTGVDKRTNQKISYRVQRIEVAASGDMAWEFSYGTIEYDKDSKHISFDTATLRTWRKVHGEWNTVAYFVRPLDQPFAPMDGGK